MAKPYCSTAFKPWQLLCDISPCSCSISGIQWNRQWGFSVEPERLFRVAGQESVIPPELENGKFSLPSFLPPEECVLVKPHSLKDENNKNKPLLLLGWQKISRLWASSINRKKIAGLTCPIPSMLRKQFSKGRSRGGTLEGAWQNLKVTVTASNLSNKEWDRVEPLEDACHSQVPNRTKRVMPAPGADGAKETGDSARGPGWWGKRSLRDYTPK